MRAVYINEFGGPEELEVRDVEDPKAPEGTEVLVRIKAAALNRADLLQRKGLYPAPPGYPERIPGLEFAGEIAEMGNEVPDWNEGDRVFGITAGGGQAEYILTREDQIARIPENLNFTEAAAIPEAFITAHDAVWTQGRLSGNESLLIHAVGSGVGLAALQIAEAKGNFVIGTSRTRDKLDKCSEFGLDVGIDTGENTNFVEMVLEHTDGKGVNVILDLVGAKYFEQNLQSLAPKGRLMIVGLVGGRNAEFDLGTALRKRLQITGTVLRSRSDQEKALATYGFSSELLGLITAGAIRPNLDKVFPVEDIRESHEYLESNASFGKVVLRF